MADPASSLGRPEPTAEELDRFASTIKASWELDDAPFAAGPAPTAADLAALNPKPENGLRAATVKLDAPPAAPAPAMAPPATAMPPVAPVAAPPPAPAARPGHAANGTMLMQRQPVPVQAQPAPAKPAFVPIATPMQSSPSLSTGEFEVPKKRTGVWIALALGVVALVGGGLFALKPSGDDTIKAAKPTVETPRENPIPPPPPPEDIPPPKATASVAAKAAETAKPPEKPEPAPKPEPVAAAKPEPKPAAKAPEPRPARPQPAPRAERPPPAAPAPAKPKAGSGGIVRDVPF